MRLLTFVRNNVQVESLRFPYHLFHLRGSKQTFPTWPMGSPNDDVSNRVRLGEVDERWYWVAGFQPHDLCSEFSSFLNRGVQAALRLSVNQMWRLLWSFNIDGIPIRVQSACQTRATPQQPVRARRTRRQANHHASHSGFLSVVARTFVDSGCTIDVFGDLAKSQLSQSRQILILKEIFQRQ